MLKHLKKEGLIAPSIAIHTHRLKEKHQIRLNAPEVHMYDTIVWACRVKEVS